MIFVAYRISKCLKDDDEALERGEVKLSGTTY